ncbi:MAG TPA: TolC family protein [Deltaproteobacteria bacterium]|nr:TolC family protein [Deltaproteobacteria bacterium]
MRTFQGFLKPTIILLTLGFFLLPVSCVSSKPGKTIENLVSKDFAADDPPKVSEIRPEIPEIPNIPEKGPIEITVRNAILIALENNRSLVVEQFNPAIQQTFEDQEQAVFDPVTGAEISAGREEQHRTASGSVTSEVDTYLGGISLEQLFPAGTFVEAEATNRTTESSLYENPLSSTRLGLSVTQPLLRGYGRDVNLVRLRQARLETDITRYELRGFSESLLARVETAYWDYALAQRQIEIVEESLKVVNQQLSETQEMILIGTMAEAELAAVQAEVAAQEQDLINTQSKLASSRLQLLRLLNPPGNNLWDRDIKLIYQSTIPDILLDKVTDHVAISLSIRPEINQTKLSIQQDDLEIIRTKNGLLPKMDLFISLGKTGYADSFSGSVSDITGDSYDVEGGIRFEYPLKNRDANARHRRAVLSREQAEKALDNLSQLVELDVRAAYIEVNRAKKQIAASSATRKFQEEKHRIETEKFRVGRSTNFLVAQAQRDLLVAKISEVNAVVDYLKSLINLYRLDGSLLERRGILAPGNEPVKSSIKPQS